MTRFYGAPNSEVFWHWPTLLHFVLVALAAGAALLLAALALRGARRLRLYALIAVAFVGLDLIVLWAESAARFRLTHIYLFLSFRPTAAIWWGAWGLAGSALLALLLALGWGPRQLWGALLLATGTAALLYPGVLLAANAARPLWSPLLLAFIPVTSLVIALALPLLARWRWVRPYAVALSVAAVALGVLYPIGLATGGAEARAALPLLWHDGGIPYLLGLALMAATPLLIGRYPALAGLVAAGGAVLARSPILELGQHSPFG